MLILVVGTVMGAGGGLVGTMVGNLSAISRHGTGS